MLSSLHICIVANKDLTFNTRVERQVQALVALGAKVKVLCLTPPQSTQTPHVYLPVHVSALERFTCVREWIWERLQRLKATNIGEAGPLELQKESTASWSSRCTVPISYLLESYLFSVAAVRLLSKEEWDLVQVHDHKALMAGFRLTKECGCNLIYDAVELPYMLTEPVNTALLRWPIEWLQAYERDRLKGVGLLTVSEGVASLMSNEYGSMPQVVRNCSLTRDVALESPMRADLGLGDDDIVFLYLNSIIPGRGVDLIVQAASELPPHAHFVFLGPSSDKSYMKHIHRVINEKGLEDRFHFPTLSPSDGVTVYASGADVGLIPSEDCCNNIRYSLPNRVFEMIMAGLPLVTSSLPDIGALVRRCDIGITFNTGDVDDFAVALKEMLNQERRQVYATRAKDLAMNELNWAIESQKYTEFVKSLV